MQQFSSDQLFFLSYTRNFCSAPDEKSILYAKIVAGLNNPVDMRVRGTLQNHPAFKSSFNCPSKAKYVNENVCNVWTTEIGESILRRGMDDSESTRISDQFCFGILSVFRWDI